MATKCVECGGHVPAYMKHLCEECWKQALNEKLDDEEEEERMTRIAVDIDGVLASKLENGNYPDDYKKKKALPNSVESLQRLKNMGYHVFLYTARFEEDREVTEQWLRDNGFEGLYEELVMGKPQFDVLIDDRAIRHEQWWKTMAHLSELRHGGSWF